MRTYKNPILYADYSDPDVVRVGEDYYMVSSSFTYIPGVPLLHSRDLVHWELINHCVKKLPFEKYALPCHGSGTWAPSIRYHEGTFFVFIPLVDEGILVARSKDPYGEFEWNMLCESKGWIDPCPFWDDDGRAYMVFAYAKSRSGIKHRLSLVEIDPQCRSLLTEPRLIFDGEQIAPTSEGPKMYKRNGYYYILMPSGGVETGWQSCLRSRSVYGPYDYRVVMHQGNSRVNGPHQGGWVTSPDGRDWFVHFQDVVELGRIIHLQPMCFLDDWPFIGQDQNGDGIGEPVREWSVPAGERTTGERATGEHTTGERTTGKHTAGDHTEGERAAREDPAGDVPEYAIRQSDDFEEKTLGLQWQWQANPDAGFYSLRENPGHLRLYCYRNPGRENLLWYAPNVLTQIPQKQKLAMTVKLSLSGREDGDFGGIGMVGHDYGYAGLYYTGEGIQVRCCRGTVTQPMFEGEAVEKVVFSQEAEGAQAWFRLTLEEDKTYGFSYSFDGRNFYRIEYSFPLKRATWTGAKLCLWSCSRENRESDGYCDYEYVEIK